MLTQRILDIKSQLARAARDPSRPPALIAVTKNVPLERIKGLPMSEIAGLGENRVQEICGKYENSANLAPIHMIGQLQTNKVKYIIDKVCLIQSVDRITLAQEIDRQAQAREMRMPVLVQVNVGEEPQKGGVAPEQAVSSVRAFAKLPGLAICGLMTVLPDTKDDLLLRSLLARMRMLFEALREEAVPGTEMLHLSMGMSSDAYLAAEEGATMVRMGSAIFGPRG